MHECANEMSDQEVAMIKHIYERDTIIANSRTIGFPMIPASAPDNNPLPVFLRLGKFDGQTVRGVNAEAIVFIRPDECINTW